MKATFLLPMLMLAGTPGYGQTIAHWTFDRSDSSSVESPAVGVPRRLSEQPARYSDEVPGAFIYDPLARQSRPNRASAVFGSGERSPEPLAVDIDFSRTGLAGQSITIECFVKPDAAARGDAWLAGKSRATESGAELSVEWHELRQHGQTWHGAAYAAPGERPTRWSAGHYSSSTRLTADASRWRHVAVVYDQPAGVVTCWVT